MKTILKSIFALAILIGMILIFLAASTLDHPGSIPITDGQILITIILGAGIAGTGALGYNSMGKE